MVIDGTYINCIERKMQVWKVKVPVKLCGITGRRSLLWKWKDKGMNENSMCNGLFNVAAPVLWAGEYMCVCMWGGVQFLPCRPRTLPPSTMQRQHYARARLCCGSFALQCSHIDITPHRAVPCKNNENAQ